MSRAGRLRAWVTWAVLALGAPSALAAPAEPNEFTDPLTGLRWSRCLEGMRWDGERCQGLPRRVTHAEALNLARQRRPAEGPAWRLPRVGELQRLIQHLAAAGPDGQGRLRAVPAGWVWTITAPVDARETNPYEYGNVQRGITAENAVHLKFLHGWAVHWPDGRAEGQHAKRERLGVLLVRGEP